jgi:hypothetical protein
MMIALFSQYGLLAISLMAFAAKASEICWPEYAGGRRY